MRNGKNLVSTFHEDLSKYIMLILTWYLGYSCAVEKNDGLSFASYTSMFLLLVMGGGVVYSATKAYRAYKDIGRL